MDPHSPQRGRKAAWGCSHQGSSHEQTSHPQLQHNLYCCREWPLMSLGSEKGAVGSHPPRGPWLAGSQDPSQEHAALEGGRGHAKLGMVLSTVSVSGLGRPAGQQARHHGYAGLEAPLLKGFHGSSQGVPPPACSRCCQHISPPTHAGWGHPQLRPRSTSSLPVLAAFLFNKFPVSKKKYTKPSSLKSTTRKHQKKKQKLKPAQYQTDMKNMQ